MTLSSGTTKKINDAVATFMNGNPVVGLILSVQQAGATVFENGYGVAVKGGSAPTTSTSFQIDSLTKAFTAIGVLHLWETGSIARLTDKYGSYVPNLPNAAWGSIQIDQMLAMCSGIPDAGSGTETYQEVLQAVAKVASYTPELVTAEDGSVTIYVQAHQPKKNTANWLPVPKGPFSLLFRVYGPQGTALAGTYVPPKIHRTLPHP